MLVNIPVSRPITRAIGGAISEVVVGGVVYKKHVFTSSDVFTVVKKGEIDFSLFGAGGSGGASGNNVDFGAGGGGGGGYQSRYKQLINTNVYDAIIGLGGAGIIHNVRNDGVSGGSTTFFNVTAFGGGRGSCPNTSATSGGCGGGAGGPDDPNLGFDVVRTRSGGGGSQGGSGGTSKYNEYKCGGGGGGGAGGAGYSGTVNSTQARGGNGGIGLYCPILQNSYSGGGGGAGDSLGGGSGGGTGTSGKRNSTSQTLPGIAGGSGGAIASAQVNEGSVKGGNGIVGVRYIK